MAKIRHASGSEGSVVLQAIGLGEEHSDVYREVLRTHSTTRDDLAAALGVPQARVRRLLDDLEQHGLIARPAGHTGQVAASPPALALRPLLQARERALRTAHEELVELTELYRDGVGERGANEVVEVVVGEEAIRQRFAQLQAVATRQVRVFVLSDVAIVSADDNIEEERALARGVRYRVIVESAVLDRPGFLDAAREAETYGEQIRVRPSLPTRLIVADDDIALLPMRTHGDDRGAGALLVHPSGLLDLLIAIFEQFWEQATAFLTDDADVAGADAVDRDLLKLLLLGLTDAGAATQLGISPRTVQRRIAGMLSRTGTTTRLQLGAEAVRRGWL